MPKKVSATAKFITLVTTASNETLDQMTDTINAVRRARRAQAAPVKRTAVKRVAVRAATKPNGRAISTTTDTPVFTTPI